MEFLKRGEFLDGTPKAKVLSSLNLPGGGLCLLMGSIGGQVEVCVGSTYFWGLYTHWVESRGAHLHHGFAFWPVSLPLLEHRVTFLTHFGF